MPAKCRAAAAFGGLAMAAGAPRLPEHDEPPLGGCQLRTGLIVTALPENEAQNQRTEHGHRC